MLVIVRQRVVVGALWMGLAGVTLLAGCEGGVEAGTVSVDGLVTVDDKPIAQASVAFIGKEGARLSSALTDSAGKFKIRAAPGKNVVTVAKAPPGGPEPPSSEEPELMPSDGVYAKMQKAVGASEVPAKYGDPNTSGLSFEISDQLKSVEVSLSSK